MHTSISSTHQQQQQQEVLPLVVLTTTTPLAPPHIIASSSRGQVELLQHQWSKITTLIAVQVHLLLLSQNLDQCSTSLPSTSPQQQLEDQVMGKMIHGQIFFNLLCKGLLKNPSITLQLIIRTSHQLTTSWINSKAAAGQEAALAPG